MGMAVEISNRIEQDDYQGFSRAMRIRPWVISRRTGSRPIALALESDSTRISYSLTSNMPLTASRRCTAFFNHGWRHNPAPRNGVCLAQAACQPVRLDPDQWVVEQPLGPQDGWYHVRSAVTFYQELIAHQQAQQQWAHSLIVSQFRAGKVKSTVAAFMVSKRSKPARRVDGRLREARQTHGSTRETRNRVS